MKAVIRVAGVTSKAGFQTAAASGGQAGPGDRADLGGRALLDLDGGAAGGLGVEAGQRPDHVEGDAVGPGQHGQAVGADLVGGVAVGGHPVAADQHGVDQAAGHGRAGGGVGHHRDRDAGGDQLPGGEAGALEQRPGLGGQHLDRLPGRRLGVDDPEGGAEPGGGQAPGVAVGEQPVAGGQLDPAGIGHPGAGGPVLLQDGQGLGQGESAQLGGVGGPGRGGGDPADRPAQVDRGRPRHLD
ncbi:MAG TPA: hypothetical protein VG409_06485, partial [Actinomycetota bacterium]|nr:hypothetical protein [Actinomycetota bacterium]